MKNSYKKGGTVKLSDKEWFDKKEQIGVQKTWLSTFFFYVSEPTNPV